MSEATRGPWELQESRDGGGTRSIIAYDEKGAWVIASVNMCMGSESEENARMISMVPRMIAALRFGLEQPITNSVSTLNEFKRLAQRALEGSND